MGIVVVPSFGSDPATVTAATLDAKVDGLATEFNGNIDDNNIKSAAAIANSKLNLTSVSQNVTLAGTNVLSGATTISGALTVSGVTTMSSKILKEAKGADVASVAGAITLGDDGNYFDITGTNAITSITAKTAGAIVTLQFDSTASLVDGSNLKLAGNFQGAAESTITLRSDGTNWFEVSRSPITSVSAATQAEMESASSTSVYSSPGRTQYHPGVAKGWVIFNGTGTPAVIASHNVDSSITDNGTGDYTLSWTTDFSSADYCAVGMAQITGGAIYTVGISGDASPAAGTIRVEVFAHDNSQADVAKICIAAFGDQA
jgi:hypothetical protein